MKRELHFLFMLTGICVRKRMLIIITVPFFCKETLFRFFSWFLSKKEPRFSETPVPYSLNSHSTIFGTYSCQKMLSCPPLDS